jgi:hypothetical protein
VIDEVDELLSTQGHLWREGLAPDPDLGQLFRRTTARRHRRSLRIAAAASLLVLVAGGLIWKVLASHWQPSASASCVGPVLIAHPGAPSAEPGRLQSLDAVRRGRQVTVSGEHYFRSCPDTVQFGQSLRTPSPQTDVQLTLTTADTKRVIFAVAHPSTAGSFTVTAEIPLNSSLGAATIRDNQGHVIPLVIVS